MRKFKKFAAMVSAVALAACAVAPMAMNLTASAATTLSLAMPTNVPTDSIIDDVKAYEIFKVSVTDTGAVNIDSWAISNTASGSETQSELAKFIAAITSEDAGLGLSNTTGSDDTKVQGVDDTKAGAEFLAKQLTEWGNSTDATTKAKIEKFAKIAAQTLTTAKSADSWSGGTATFNTNLENGYYLFTGEIQIKDGQNVVQKSTSLGMLTVVDGKANGKIGTGEAKVGLPTVQKKVKEDTKGATVKADYEATGTQNNKVNGETTDKYAWNDVADYDIGDEVPFKLYGTMPDNLAQYDKYYYMFTDTLDSQFAMPTSLTITIDPDGAGSKPAVTYTASYTDSWSVSTTGDENKTGINVAYTTDENETTKKTGFTVEFEDIKTNQGVDKDALVTIEYDAVLKTTAKVGRPGQENKVNLTYSNNPNNAGKGETDTTPDDEVKVFTYGFEIEKQFFAYGSETPLAFEEVAPFANQVKFEIKKKNSYDSIKFSEYTNATGEYFDYVVNPDSTKAELGLTVIDKDKKEYTVGTDSSGNTTLTTGVSDNQTVYTIKKDEDDGKFKVYDSSNIEVTGKEFQMVLRVKGLDDGTYTLEETNAPTGYNKVTSDFIIKAETDNKQNWNSSDTDSLLKGFDEDLDGSVMEKDVSGNYTSNYQYTDGIAEELIKNNQGSELPSTGGIGTTIFYIGGGAMVAVAGVFLITKKRMSKKEN